MPPKDKVQFAGLVTAPEAAQYLESLAKGLRERTILCCCDHTRQSAVSRATGRTVIQLGTESSALSKQ